MIKHKWPFYLMEALSLAGFVIAAVLTTMLLEYPASPVMKTGLVNHPFIRRVILGIVMAVYITLITLWAGKKSGAHANPIVTWVFFRLHKISGADACAYIAAQFAGATGAVILLNAVLHPYFSDPMIDYSRAKPVATPNLMHGFVAELIISFLFVSALLFGLTAKKLDKFMGMILGLLIALFIIFELPYSSMSMNPARSFSGAFAAHKWADLWIYFTAPVLAMLLAGDIFVLWQRNLQGVDAAGQPVVDEHKFFGSQPLPAYPMQN